MRPLSKADRPSPERFNQSVLTDMKWHGGLGSTLESHKPRSFTPGELAWFDKMRDEGLLRKMAEQAVPLVMGQTEGASVDGLREKEAPYISGDA